MKKKTTYRYRSSITGRFVTARKAKRAKKTTVRESVEASFTKARLSVLLSKFLRDVAHGLPVDRKLMTRPEWRSLNKMLSSAVRMKRAQSIYRPVPNDPHYEEAMRIVAQELS